MISRALKDFYYKIASPLLRVNGWIYKNFRFSAKKENKVQLGPGQRNYLPGWINLDANIFTKIDVAVDLRHSLPFKDNSIDCFYSFHVIEHLPDLRKHFLEVKRCLKPGGVYRVGGPNGDSAINRFVHGDAKWFGDFPEKRESIGGRFENFIFCKGEHLTILLESYLREVFSEVGFNEVRVGAPVKGTNFPELFSDCLGIEYEDNFEYPHSIVLEAIK